MEQPECIMREGCLQQTSRLRKFNINDLGRVTYINRTCLPENYSDYFFVDLHRRFPETFIVAEEDGEIVGYILCRIETGLSSSVFRGLTKKGHIVSVAVLPEYRRRGIAKALVVTAMKNMRLYNATQCFLEVRVTNTAAADLYRNLSFQIARTVRGYYADGEDAYVMRRELTS